MSLFVFQRRGFYEVHIRTSGPSLDGGTLGVNGAAAPLKNKKKVGVWMRCYKQATPLRGLRPRSWFPGRRCGIRRGVTIRTQLGLFTCRSYGA